MTENRSPNPEVADEIRRQHERRQEEIVTLLRRRAPDRSGRGCFCCGLILEDIEKNGKLTGYPLDAMGSGTFPVAGKRRHLELELMSLDKRRS